MVCSVVAGRYDACVWKTDRSERIRNKCTAALKECRWEKMKVEKAIYTFTALMQKYLFDR